MCCSGSVQVVGLGCPPRSKDSLLTRLVQFVRQSTPWLETIPKAYGQKLNSKGYKFGDAVALVQDHGGRRRTGYVVGHTATRCTVVLESIHLLFERLSVVLVPNSAIRFTSDLLLLGRGAV